MSHNMTTKEAAIFLGYHQQTLRNLASKQKGPPFRKCQGTRRVFYDQDELAAWKEAHYRETPVRVTTMQKSRKKS